MAASDWIRKVYRKESDYTEAEMAENLKNAQTFVNSECNMTVAEGFKLLRSDRFLCYRYTLRGESIYVSFLDKTLTERKAWRLAFFSYDAQNVSSTEIVGIIVRAIIEFMREQYAQKIDNLGDTFTGIYYYTPIKETLDRAVMWKVLAEVNRTLKATNYRDYVELSVHPSETWVQHRISFRVQE